MPDVRRCPRCGVELASDAPEGMCPQCLLQHALPTTPVSDADPGARGDSVPSAKSDPRHFTAPTPGELAAHFPQLEILELLGQGGMGAVYKAREPALDRLVAVKILPPESARDPAFAERFHREARALAKLNHPNVVHVYGIGQTPSTKPLPPNGTEVSNSPLVPSAEGGDGVDGPLFYFIMEYVDGTNLRQLLRSGQCKPDEALKIVPQICEALQFAHDEGIVHRDIKPENILVDRRGRVKIADFGLAKLLGRGTGGSPASPGAYTGP